MKKLLLIFTLLLCLPAHANGAELDRATKAYLSGDYQTALPLLKSLAKQGDVPAQSILGFMYGFGKGVPKNYAESFKWYRKAAEQGDADAQDTLGRLYYFGTGVSQNYAEALKWYSKSAEQGYAEAQSTLARMYYKGVGISKNYIKAYIWESIAIANDDKNDNFEFRLREEFLQTIEKEMNSASITKAQELAKQCWESNYQNCGE